MKSHIITAIDSERAYQQAKYGEAHQQSLPGYLLIIQNELKEAMEGWAKDSTGRNSPMSEICQIAAVCVAAMEAYGTEGSAIPTNDIRLTK